MSMSKGDGFRAGARQCYHEKTNIPYENHLFLPSDFSSFTGGERIVRYNPSGIICGEYATKKNIWLVHIAYLV
ncbi:MAG: hypothetical protein WA071_12735 [Undibacterium umbellatum]|uniref:hypothetical protein n=1 Tax=Undibacterium umbellatum TaxID=2762300 RepID=UPI003BB62DB8